MTVPPINSGRCGIGRLFQAGFVRSSKMAVHQSFVWKMRITDLVVASLNGLAWPDEEWISFFGE